MGEATGTLTNLHATHNPGHAAMRKILALKE
jgi:hypothetical protein